MLQYEASSMQKKEVAKLFSCRMKKLFFQTLIELHVMVLMSIQSFSLTS